MSAGTGRIALTPQQLRTSAAKYTNGANDIRGILRTLVTEQEVIRANWEGQAFRNYDAQFLSLKPKVNDFAALLDSINAQLNSVATIIEQTDQQIAGQINTLGSQ